MAGTHLKDLAGVPARMGVPDFTAPRLFDDFGLRETHVFALYPLQVVVWIGGKYRLLQGVGQAQRASRLRSAKVAALASEQLTVEIKRRTSARTNVDHVLFSFHDPLQFEEG